MIWFFTWDFAGNPIGKHPTDRLRTGLQPAPARKSVAGVKIAIKRRNGPRPQSRLASDSDIRYNSVVECRHQFASIVMTPFTGSVFITHAVEDRALVKKILDDLKKHDISGASVLRDVANRAALSESQFRKAIRKYKYFIPLISNHSVNAAWLEPELKVALKSEMERFQVLVLPLLVDNVDMPPGLHQRTPVDFTKSYSGAFDDLLARLTAPNELLSPPIHKSRKFYYASVKVAHFLSESINKGPELTSRLSADRFSSLVTRAFKEASAKPAVELLSIVRDGGVDVVMVAGTDADNNPILIQCKQYEDTRKVGVEVVRSLYESMGRFGEGVPDPYPAKIRVLITTSEITAAAKEKSATPSSYSRDRVSIFRDQAASLLKWLAGTPGLDPKVTTPVEQLRQRHSELVDKKFESKLSDAEVAELARINDELDDLETPIYKPIEDKLQKEFDRLVAENVKKEQRK
jgi:hypothetical protein